MGSNPEAILFVEAHQAQSGELSWKYGLVRMSAAEVIFLLDEAEVWIVPQSFGGSTATYYCFTRPIASVGNPDVNSLKKAIE